ncbi:VOC family protein [Actinomycetospora cinnamomea]|uniref:Putative glyoxalase superfamily protein PhnB n=1 Tax=Actinomycetospora cinnamomea TaxID=663609 RepID=A0A2U1FM44_9PSEU|nr:VOC family protein [Actinomycetospora cinnamomea]PVZ13258.1 putative glyoxalase superfamily protein PhnB [Actinomycetospora cinnamomea]
MNDKTPAPQVWPTLAARDARALMSFLTDVLGFTEVVDYAGDDGVIQHAELAGPAGGGIMMGQQRPGAEGRATPTGSFTAYVVLPEAAEIDALAARVRDDGRGAVVQGPYDTDYGSHDVALRDPEGNHWQFGTYPGAPRP